MNNEIAVIIPTYNSEKTIKRAIDSVRNQIIDNYAIKIIVVDDLSEDKTREIVRRLKHVVLHTNYERSGGPNAGRNTGMELADGAKYIAFLDHDDEWNQGKLKAQIDTMDQTGINISFTGYRIINNDRVLNYVYGNDNIVKYEKNAIFKILAMRHMTNHVLPYMSSLVLRNENVPEFDHSVYDYGWSLKLFENQEVIYIDRLYLNRYEGYDNLSNDKEYLDGGIDYIDKTLRKYKKYREAKWGIKNFNFNYYMQFLMSGDKKKAYKALWRTFV